MRSCVRACAATRGAMPAALPGRAHCRNTGCWHLSGSVCKHAEFMHTGITVLQQRTACENVAQAAHEPTATSAATPSRWPVRACPCLRHSRVALGSTPATLSGREYVPLTWLPVPRQLPIHSTHPVCTTATTQTSGGLTYVCQVPEALGDVGESVLLHIETDTPVPESLLQLKQLLVQGRQEGNPLGQVGGR